VITVLCSGLTASASALSLCDGDFLTLTATSTNGGTITWDNGVTDGLAFAPATGVITYNATSSSTLDCAFSVDVTVNVLPTVVASVDDNDVCLGDGVVFTGSGAATYAWDNAVTDGASFTAGAAGNVTYTVTGTDANGCVNTSSVDANVNGLPVVVANVDDNDVCLGDAIVFSGAGASTYVWDNAVTDGASFTPASIGNVTYNVTGTDANGCVNTSSVDANVNGLPTVTSSVDDNDVCLGDGVIFTGSGATTYAWDNGVTDGTSFTAGTVGNVTYNVTGTDANGCVNTSSVDANVNGLPTVVASVDDNDVCLGNGVVFTGSGATTYAWDNGVTDGATFNPASASNITYTVTGTDANGCVNTSSVDANVNGLPTVVASVDNANACLGGAVVFTGSGALTYVWDNGVTDGASFTPASTGNVTYNLTGTDANGCVNTSSVDANVNGLPTVTSSVDNNDICLGDSIIFTGVGALTYVWDNGVTDAILFTPIAIGNVTYTVTGTDVNGCVNTSSVDANANALPVVLASVDFNNICLGDTVVFTGSGAATYTWDNGVIDGALFNPMTSGNVTYTVTVMDAAGCSNTASVDVMANEVIIAYTTGDELFGNDGSIDLTVSGGTNAYTFDWDNDGTSDFDDTEDLSGLIGGTYIIVVIDGNGCEATDTVVVNTQLSIADRDNILIDVFPNPTTDNLTIQLKGNFRYELMTISGQMITNGTGVDSKRIDMENLSSGAYLINVVSNNSNKVVRVVKQ
jgi:hypothetical protein